jgi:glycosyltransferase involved in cell wall biosynthesis
MPKVSAIISAYYCEEYLEGRITNLLNQSLAPEIVVVCQKGSEEFEVSEQFNLQKNNFRLLLTEITPTIYGAWNTGILFSAGDYIINANADDRFTLDAIEDMAEALDEHPEASMIYGSAYVIEKLGGKVIGQVGNREGDYQKLKNDYYLGPFQMWRRSLHAKYGYFDESLQVAGDYDFWLRCAKGGEKFYHLPGYVGTYLKRPDSAEHRQPIVAKYENQLVRERFANA